MTRRRPPFSVREAVAALAVHGHAADVDLDGAHLKVRWIVNGRRHLLVIARSPSDCRAQANSRATLRRLLREGERPQ
jgi:hypothetical protein